MNADSDFKIWPPFEAFYIEAMSFNSVSALISCTTMNAELEKAPEELNAEVVLNAVQNIALQGAALSRYFWPTEIKKTDLHNSRARHLRQVFAVEDSSALKDRALRNAMEHFDERLDVYLQKYPVGNIIPSYVGPKPESDGVLNHLFRAYYTDVAVFEVLGERYKIIPIIEEIGRIHNLLNEFSESGYRFVKG